LVADATAAVLEAAGLTADDAGRVWVLTHEQPEGTWGAGGQVVRYADLISSPSRKGGPVRELTYTGTRAVELREAPVVRALP